MKNIFLTILLACISFSFTLAQTPEMINYQAIARDINGNFLADRAVNIELHILSGSSNGTSVFSETHSLTTNSYGLFSLKIGAGTIASGSMDAVDWGQADHFLQVSLDPNGGTNYELIGTSQLVSVPYALYAKNVAQESQKLSISGNDLSISGTNTVSLDNLGPWTSTPSTIYTTNKKVGIGTTPSAANLTVRNNMYLTNPAGDVRVINEVVGAGIGRMILQGPNGNDNIRATWLSGAENFGYLAIRNDLGENRASLYVSSSNTGLLRTYGPNGNQNANMSWLTNYNNHGFVAVKDGGGNTQAGVYVNSSGDGIVFGDTKNFRMEHPTDPDLEIWYASLEGPEAAAYERGTSKLVNGKAQITFSDHFQMVCDGTGMTVILTPLSGDSKGMAVINKSAEGFEVLELMQGKGNYEFDWEVKAVRKGYENYRVIRNKIEAMDAVEEKK